MLDWEVEAQRDMRDMQSQIKRLKESLFVAETERDELLRRCEEMNASHAEDLGHLSKTRARQRWDTARRRTQIDEKLKKLKVQGIFNTSPLLRIPANNDDYVMNFGELPRE